MNRFVPLLVAASLLGLALPASASGPLRGTVVLREDPSAANPRVVVQTAGGRELEVQGQLAERIRLFEGLAVELEGRTVEREGAEAFAAETIVSPREELLAASVSSDAEGTWLEVGGRRLRAAGRASLLEPGERVRALVWTFPGDLAVVEAIEAETTSTWTITYQLANRASLPADLVRGKRRSVWITAREDEWLRVRRGQREGWVRAERVERVRPPEPRRAASRGLVGGVAQER